MNSARDDLAELSEYAWLRLRSRLDGLTEAEYRWEPAPGFTTLAWRLDHIAGMLREERNGPWLGRPAPPARETGRPGDAVAALAELDEAHECWQAVLAGCTEESLRAPIGTAAGPYGEASRHSFALHVLDELIHHGAEVALLRDLYAATEPQEKRSSAQ